MTHGRKICNTLKQIRQQIAEKNEIEYATSDCHFEGECKGTCPKCESELQYLENELHRRTQLGKAVAVAGISLGMVGTFSACNTSKQTNTPIAEQKITTDTVNFDTIPVTSKNSVRVTGTIIDTIHQEGIVLKDFEDENVPLMGIVERFPEYPGGEEALYKLISENLIYPQEVKNKGIEGRVVISFFIEEDGSLTNFTILRSAHPLLDEEALRAAKLMPKWKAGTQRGKPVRVQYQIPVIFSLD